MSIVTIHLAVPDVYYRLSTHLLARREPVLGLPQLAVRQLVQDGVVSHVDARGSVHPERGQALVLRNLLRRDTRGNTIVHYGTFS